LSSSGDRDDPVQGRLGALAGVQGLGARIRSVLRALGLGGFFDRELARSCGEELIAGSGRGPLFRSLDHRGTDPHQIEWVRHLLVHRYGLGWRLTYFAY
jgi:hypothetical protein